MPGYLGWFVVPCDCGENCGQMVKAYKVRETYLTNGCRTRLYLRTKLGYQPRSQPRTVRSGPGHDAAIDARFNHWRAVQKWERRTGKTHPERDMSMGLE